MAMAFASRTAATSDGAGGEISIIGNVQTASTLRVPTLPTFIACGHDRALRPLVAMRWVDKVPERFEKPEEATLLHLWDARPAASHTLVPVVAADTGKPLKVLAVAMDGCGCCIAASDTGELWACGATGTAWMLFPALPPQPSNGHQFLQIACGGAHAVALTRSGLVYAWGSNARGQLGVGDTRDRTEPTRVDCDGAAAQAAGAAEAQEASRRAAGGGEGGGGAAAAAAGGGRRGSMRGHASSVRVGAGGGIDSSGSHTIVIGVSASLAHTLCVSSVGALFAWGDGGDGRLGLGESQLRHTELEAGRTLQERRPYPVAVPPPPPISHEAAMRRLSLTSVSSTVKSAVFAARLKGLRSGNKASGADGQGGAEAEAEAGGAGLLRLGLSSGWVRPPSEDRWSQCACGERESAGVTSGGQLLTWGRGADGRLGHGKPYVDLDAPKVVSQLRGIEIIRVALGRAHGLAISKNGRIFTWGCNDRGQLGPRSAAALGDLGIPRPITVIRGARDEL